MTNGADCLKREPSYFKKQYDELVNAMDLVGFTDEEEDNLFSIIAAILHMGNVTFEMDDDEASFVEDENGPVKMAAVSNVKIIIEMYVIECVEEVTIYCILLHAIKA